MKQIKSKNINAPPRFAQTCWNSIFICVEYIIKNFSSIESTIQFFEHNKHKCSLIINENIKLQLASLYNSIELVNNFTNKVQHNFVSAGDIYYYLIQFETEMAKITDPYNFASILQKNILIRFKETCDSTIALLCFILTKESRKWWKEKLDMKNAELSFLISNSYCAPSLFIRWFNNNETLIINKIGELANNYHINNQMATDTFSSWVNYSDNNSQSPIDYWATSMTLCTKVNGKVFFFFFFFFFFLNL